MNNTTKFYLISILTFLFSCSENKSKESLKHEDICDNCKMKIADTRYVSQLKNQNGEVYTFDDISCLEKFIKKDPQAHNNTTQYVTDFSSGKILNRNEAILIKGGEIKSPMGGNTQAFENKTQAEQEALKLGAEIVIE